MKRTFLEAYPDLVSEWNTQKNGEFKNETIAAKSHNKVWWICSQCGNEWMASISNRTGRGSGCPKCRKAAGARTRIQYRIKNDQTDFKSWCEQQGERGRQLLKEWNYELNKHVNPSEISYGSTEKVFWQCKNSHIWKASLNGRTQGRDCPICSGKKVLEGYNDLQSKYPLIAKEF